MLFFPVTAFVILSMTYNKWDGLDYMLGVLLAAEAHLF